jgi:hypothetical protein
LQLVSVLAHRGCPRNRRGTGFFRVEQKCPLNAKRRVISGGPYPECLLGGDRPIFSVWIAVEGVSRGFWVVYTTARRGARRSLLPRVRCRVRVIAGAAYLRVSLTRGCGSRTSSDIFMTVLLIWSCKPALRIPCPTGFGQHLGNRSDKTPLLFRLVRLSYLCSSI